MRVARRDEGELMTVKGVSDSGCPSSSTIGKLAAGRLDESLADEVLEHIDQCGHCQTVWDEGARETDSLLSAARRGVRQEAQEESSHLQSLMRRAAVGTPAAVSVADSRVAASDDTKVQIASSRQVVSRDKFVRAVRLSGLLTRPNLTRWLADIDELDRRADDAGALAQHLVRQRLLTPFQARLLVLGRWRGLVLGSYEIVDQIGAGGMGKLFVAKHRQLNRKVCIKMIRSRGPQSEAMLERFNAEVRALGALSHENIVRALDAGQSAAGPYLVMEYVEGVDLAKYVRKHGPLSWQEALQVARQAALALAHAHRQGVIHRDVKPHNLLVRQQPSLAAGQVGPPCVDASSMKLLDMGLARFDGMLSQRADTSVIAAMTEAGVVVGTVDYMAPEQALDSRNADARSDVYGLGCTLFFLLTGKPPYRGETVMQRLVAHREQPVPSLTKLRSDLPPHVVKSMDALLARMLNKQPDQRQPTMVHVAEDIDVVLRGGGFPAAPTCKVESSASAASASPLVHVVAVPPEPPPLPVALAPPQHATQIRKAGRGARGSQVPWVSRRAVIGFAIVSAMLCLCGLFYLALSPWPDTLRAGGRGRILLIVSSEKFDTRQFESLRDAFRRRNIEITTTSPHYGVEGERDFALSLKQTTECVSMREDAAGAYDAVCLIDGHYDLYKDPGHSELTRAQLAAALETGIPVCATKEGLSAVFHLCDGWEELRTVTGMKGIDEAKHVRSKSRLLVAKDPGAYDLLVERVISLAMEANALRW
ncbi:MAG: serine/threonine protein kinase [Planctomycetales bacterium]|nr:serine/threonine protein kinase [Planctomycetales bacterium]